MWDNHQGLSPKQPYQPEFVVILIRKYLNGTVLASEAEILSNNDGFGANNTDKMEKWFKCYHHSDFMLAAIDEANDKCRQMFSTIQSYYSKVYDIVYDMA